MMFLAVVNYQLDLDLQSHQLQDGPPENELEVGAHNSLSQGWTNLIGAPQLHF